MDFLPELISQYAEDLTSPESQLLQELNRETNAKVLMPRMLSGHLQGQWLSFVSKMIRPNAILEIGTFTGYSAICLAQGLPENGVLHTIDINEELEKMVRGYFVKAGLGHKIQYHLGNALQIIPKLPGNFDLVFIDADKINYSRYYDLIFDRVSKGGFIMADNVLWSGKVLNVTKDKETQAIHDFNTKVKNDARVENLLLPLRDGIMIARKLV